MTVESTLNRKSYTGDDVTVAFATSPMVFFEEGDLEVYLVVTATGVATLQTITTHYTVTGGEGSTGTVTMLTAPASTQTLVIVRNLDIVQEADLVNNDASDAEVLEDALDKGVMILQQLDARLDRAFVLPDSDISGASTELPTPEASTLIGWNDDADALINYSAGDIAPDVLVSTYAETFLDDESGADVRTTIGAGDLVPVSSVSGTNTITGAITAPNTAYVSGGIYVIVPANTNTGATTLNLTPAGASALGAKNIFRNGAAVVGGELRQSIPALLQYDGTQFNIVGNSFGEPTLDTHPIVQGSADGTKKVRLEVDGLTTATTRVVTVPDRDLTLSDGPTNDTIQATTSGTSKDFTIPSWAKRITVSGVNISTNGTSPLTIQLGDAGGIETTGYEGAVRNIDGSASAVYSAGVGFTLSVAQVAAGTYQFVAEFVLHNAATFLWAGATHLSRSDSVSVQDGAGSKALTAALTTVRLTTNNGTDAFDLGSVNVQYQ